MFSSCLRVYYFTLKWSSLLEVLPQGLIDENLRYHCTKQPEMRLRDTPLVSGSMQKLLLLLPTSTCHSLPALTPAGWIFYPVRRSDVASAATRVVILASGKRYTVLSTSWRCRVELSACRLVIICGLTVAVLDLLGLPASLNPGQSPHHRYPNRPGTRKE